MLLLDKLAENKIKAAIDVGEFDNLDGAGKPLALDDDSQVPAELRMGVRILKNSGFLPAELAMVREIQNLEVLLNRAECTDEKARLVTKLSLLKSLVSNR